MNRKMLCFYALIILSSYFEVYLATAGKRQTTYYAIQKGKRTTGAF